MQLIRIIVLFFSFTLILVVTTSKSHAYPQFQLSTDNARCSMCHVSPSGGGLLNAYGRSESADTISFQGKGNGDWLYGLYDEPSWLKLGADFRYAAVRREQSSEIETLNFLMLSDIYAQFRFSKTWSLYVNVGPRAQARRPGIKSPLSRLNSREHYVMWRPKSRGHAIRAGRFMMPFGLRSQDHTHYVRRNLGLYAWDETYNIAYARVENNWETHATLFYPVPFFLQSGDTSTDMGAAWTYERRIGEEKQTALSGQARFGRNANHRQWVLGGTAKHNIASANLLLSGELNLVVEDLNNNDPTRTQSVSYLGATYFPIQGVMLTAAHEYWNPDFAVSDTDTHGFSFNLQLFPWAKWELHLLTKLELLGQSNRQTKSGMLQLHYYL